MKHYYLVYYVDSNGSMFTSTCINDSIIGAIALYENKGYSVRGIQKVKQAKLNSENAIVD